MSKITIGRYRDVPSIIVHNSDRVFPGRSEEADPEPQLCSRTCSQLSNNSSSFQGKMFSKMGGGRPDRHRTARSKEERSGTGASRRGKTSEWAGTHLRDWSRLRSQCPNWEGSGQGNSVPRLHHGVGWMCSLLLLCGFSAGWGGDGGGREGGERGVCFQTSRAVERRERSAVSKTRTALPIGHRTPESTGYGNKVWHSPYLSPKETRSDPKSFLKTTRGQNLSQRVDLKSTTGALTVWWPAAIVLNFY